MPYGFLYPEEWTERTLLAGFEEFLETRDGSGQCGVMEHRTENWVSRSDHNNEHAWVT